VNLWEFPGGKIEQDETKVRALRRELAEELRIQVSIQEEDFELCRNEYDFSFVNLTTFICVLGEVAPQLTEHIQVKSDIKDVRALIDTMETNDCL